MSNVMLVGAFGQGNPGDEALCAAFCAALGDHEVTIVSAHPAASSRDHGRPSMDAQARSVGPLLRRADVVVVGGGTVFKQLAGSTGRSASSLLARTAGLVAGAHAAGAKVAMIGVGAGAMRGRLARSLCRWVVPRTDLLVLRDEESASVLAGVGARPPFWIGADPAWGLFHDRVDDARGLTDRRSITVALSHHAVQRTGVDALVASLRPLSAGWTIRLQPWQAGPNDLDRQLAEHLWSRIEGAEIIGPPRDLVEAAQVFAEDDLVIGMRFHALVAAAAAGTRFVAIAHEPKLAGIARRLQQASVPVHASAEVMSGIVAWALANEPSPRAAVGGEMEAAAHEFQLLHLLLDGGAFEQPDRLAALPLSSGRGSW